mmetsp:Transcript_41950/g.96272  ORF Transcript_41950/g.96272 Transcript_41950/m.96272 type:complete len:432 (+) Transcript_41950:63-1358(+)
MPNADFTGSTQVTTGSLTLPSSPPMGGRLSVRSTSEANLQIQMGRTTSLMTPRSSLKQPHSFADSNFFVDREASKEPPPMYRANSKFGHSGSFHGGAVPPSPRRGSKHRQSQADSLTLFALDVNVAGAGPSAEALSAARSHLGQVVQQIEWLHRRIDQEKDSAIGVADRDRQTIDGLRREVRHLQVDLQHANKQSEQLIAEKHELLQVQVRLEAELRSARDALEASKQQLRHRSTDVQQLARQLVNADMTPAVLVSPRVDASNEELAQDSQESAAARNVDAPSEEPKSQQRSQLPPQGSSSDDASLRNPMLQAVAELSSTKAQMPSSKAQALAAVKAAQAEVQWERKKREKLERQLQKDHSRLLKLVAVTQQQREEIRLLESSVQGVDDHGLGGEQVEPRGAVSDSAFADPPEPASATERHHSAPTKLPPV